jgi:hypothetical protein
VKNPTFAQTFLLDRKFESTEICLSSTPDRTSYAFSLSSSALASFRSVMSKPSANQPSMPVAS